MNKFLIGFAICLLTWTNQVAAQDNIDIVASLNNLYSLESLMQDAVDVNKARAEAEAYIDLIESLDQNYYNSDHIPQLLFKAGDVSVGLGNFEKANDLWSKLVRGYPEHELKARAIFFQGFVLDTKQGKSEEAKKKYTEFINNFPNHELIGNARLLLSQLGSSDADLLKQFKSDNN